jgi:hypothetical protein
MGVLVFGTTLYGSVDRVPGLCYVATMFFHAFYLPLIPLGTMIVEEGSERGNIFERTVEAKHMWLCPKSVLAGYLRGWLGGVALLFFTGAGFIIPLDVGVYHHLMNETLAIAVAVFAMLFGAFGTFFVLMTRHAMWIPIALALHASSLGLLIFASQPGNFLLRVSAEKWTSALIIANVALVVYSLTRLWDRASHARAVELAESLGIDAATLDDLLQGTPKQRRRHRAEEDEEGGQAVTAAAMTTACCPYCHATYRWAGALSAKKVRCRKCQEVVVLEELLEEVLPDEKPPIRAAKPKEERVQVKPPAPPKARAPGNDQADEGRKRK